MPKKKLACIICKHNNLEFIFDFSKFSRLTSDCKPFEKGGKLAVCLNCGLVQKIPDQKWLTEINQIYSEYSAYSIADGSEQLVVDARTGLLSKRSDVIASNLYEKCDFSDEGMVLDVGCGHGVTLAAFQKILPNWKLYGYELDDSKVDHLNKIKNFQGLLTENLSDIKTKFNLVTMVHSLEHFVNPLETLIALKNLLKPAGRLFIQVCNVEENPFDILIADHLTHFSPDSLSFAANAGGYEVELICSNWVKKEISAVLRLKTLAPKLLKNDQLGKDSFLSLHKKNIWLSRLVEKAGLGVAGGNSYGIFGTSIAATWIALELGGKIDFFVDEDPNRIGKIYLEKVILSPASIPKNSVVFLAMAPVVARHIAVRLRANIPGVNFIEPPAGAGKKWLCKYFRIFLYKFLRNISKRSIAIMMGL